MAFGIYVHWPFCAGKCPYCDFNSHVRSQIDEELFVSAILNEMDWVRSAQACSCPAVETIFFGGGTPSLMGAKSVERIVDKIAALWALAKNVEVTLEANPASADAQRFEGYRQAGVNRLSLGIQALDEFDLKSLGRLHDVAQAKNALKIALGLFEHVSLDLIYARPRQSVAKWRRELDEALEFGTEHMSLYQLTIEPHTPFALLHETGKLEVPDEDLAADLYELTQELTGRAGLGGYEVSNHARKGAECRHNLIYWRYEEYAGFGPGAHGRLHLNGQRMATSAIKLPERWKDNVKRIGHGYADITPLSNLEAQCEHLLMSMRLAEGLNLEQYEKRWGIRPSAFSIGALCDQGLTRCDDERLIATPKGRLLLNRILEQLA